ncbi:amino acid ABC transporter permease [Leucobacter sp. GX24907]
MIEFFTEWLTPLPRLLGGLWVSLKLTGLSLLAGVPLGLILAVLNETRSKAVRSIAIVLVEIGRGTPALVMLQVIYFGLPSIGVSLTSFLSAAVALALTTAAYTSEIIRGGLQAVPQGEIEAAQALSMNSRDTLRFIIIPQGFRVALPALMGFAILIFQGTSLAYTVALSELLGTAYSIGSSTFKYLDVLILAGFLYAAITIPASYMTERVEKRLGRHAH